MCDRFSWYRGNPSRIERPGTPTMTTVIFACVENAGRSQMAAAFFNALADPTRIRAVSAGTEPGDRVHPEVVAVMREAGIDLSGASPSRLTDDLARAGRLLVTMGCEAPERSMPASRMTATTS